MHSSITLQIWSNQQTLMYHSLISLQRKIFNTMYAFVHISVVLSLLISRPTARFQVPKDVGQVVYYSPNIVL
jgi:hypothetical protein